MVAGRDAHVTINQGLARDVAQQLEEWADSKDREIADLKRRLADSYQKQIDAIPGEADAWAETFVRTLSERKKLAELRLDERRKAVESLEAETTVQMRLSVEVINTSLRALERTLQGTRFIKLGELPDIYERDSDSGGTFPISRVEFPNGCSLVAELRQGVDAGTQIWPDAELSVREPEKCKGRAQMAIRISRQSPTLGGGPDVQLSNFEGDERRPQLREKVQEKLDWIVGEVAVR